MYHDYKASYLSELAAEASGLLVVPQINPVSVPCELPALPGISLTLKDHFETPLNLVLETTHQESAVKSFRMFITAKNNQRLTSFP